MNKIKLGDVLEVKRGMSLPGEYYATEGDYIRLTLGNFNYPSCGWKKNVLKDNLFFTGNVRDEYILKKGDIITPLTEQVRGLLGNTATIPEDALYIQSGDIGLIIPDETKLDKRFSYYLVSSSVVKKQLDARSQQTKIRHTSPEAIKDCVAFIPIIKEQKKISYLLDCINKKIEDNNAINDNLQQQLCLIYENMMCKAQYGNIEGTFTVASKLTDVVTGKEDANFASPNGKYKFFTCSNDTLNCDEYVFDSSAILIAGNGDFNVKHYSGKFNAYQRTYVLIPDHQYYGLLYFASLYQINSFKSASSGSIVKFITKGDIENIPVFIPNDEHILNELNRLLALQEKNQAENEELSSLRDWLLPMLMNGQASISD